MSDDTVRAALRSDAPLVLVEAPAGCGKTHQGADYAREVAVGRGSNRLLILTHTHAACSTFSDRTKGTGSRAEIRTIDSVITHIASAYHIGLGLPADTATWVWQRDEGYAGIRSQGRYLTETPSDDCGMDLAQRVLPSSSAMSTRIQAAINIQLS